jgi:hypothetical protein
MYSEITISKLNAIAQRYKDLIQQSVQSVLSQYKNTGAGVDSVVVDVVDGNASKAPQIIIQFDDHVLILDKRKVQWTKLPDMKDMLAWAETKKPTREEAEQLAWAVAWDKKKNDTWKPKSWRKKSLSGVLKEMNQLILQEYDEAIEQELQNAIKV